MKTRNSEQYKKKKQRKQIYSVTLDPDVVAASVSCSVDGNFSKHVEEALKHYNEVKQNEQLSTKT